MAASREERAYRNLYKKCVKGESTNRLLEELIKKRIGLKDVEEFVRREAKTHKGGGTEENFNSKITKHKEERGLVENIMRRKLLGNSKYCIKLRRDRNLAEKTLINILGGKNRVYHGIMKDVKKNGEKLKNVLKMKNAKKVKWLSEKYEVKIELLEDLTEYERMKYGSAEILDMKKSMKGDELREPEIVCGVGEELTLSQEEKLVLALGPKFCVRKTLDEEEFSGQLEECIAKIKWEFMVKEMKEKKEKEDISNANIMAILDDEEKREVEEYEEELEAKMRTVFHREDMSWDYGRKRTTDLKGNTMVVLPGRRKIFQEEANLEMLRTELKGFFKEYMKKHCDNKGNQESNLTKGELRGLKNLKKMVKNEELVVLPTDKSGRFSVMSVTNYLRAGQKHTKTDIEVEIEEVTKTQNELNGNVSMAIKFFKIGSNWKHGDRVRSTLINHSLNVCPMYLTYKDHKGWKGEDNSPPPTRPIAGGNAGMNLHISEILSEIIEPIVDAHVGSDEIISTEDMKARFEILNERKQDWRKWDWWEGKFTKCGKYVCCTKCSKYEGVPPSHAEMGMIIEMENMNDEYYDEVTEDELNDNLCECITVEEQKMIDEWEKLWETPEGIDDDGFWDDPTRTSRRKRITRVNPMMMKKLRKIEWKKEKMNEDLEDINKEWSVDDMLEEDIQNFEEEMVLVGCDVEALYPSLDRDECSRIIGEEIMKSNVSWSNLDYMEGARMIVLNKSASYCRKHSLHRVLPVRRYRTGSRPGVTVKRPLGAGRGDQEQWRFPLVKLTEEEKRMIIAEVTKIITEAMFDTHIYTFGGKMFKQKKGGPIGLRGTCAIARLIMCHWDLKWKEVMRRNRITLEEYMRYMDDGRAFLSPIRSGWRWSNGRMTFKKVWQEEDRNLGGLEVTRRILDSSMQEVLNCLRFTTEVGEGEEAWLPTLDLMVRVEKGNKVSFRYYEKPTTTNVMVQRRSAMEENTRHQILSNDLIRRLGNTDKDQEDTVFGRVVDQFGKKILTSGYSLSQTRKILLNGIRGWERKVTRSRKEGKRMFRKAEESLKGRILKKTVGKTSWYRKRKKRNQKDQEHEKTSIRKEGEGGNSGRRKGNHQKESMTEEEELKVAAVLFVENSKEGELAKGLRNVIERIKHILGYTIKVVERSGTPLRLMFPLTKIKEGKECGRDDCTTCMQESKGEKVPPCKKRSVMYENICLRCNPGAGGEENKKVTPPTYPPSIYVGETSKSMYERAKQHWADYRAGHEDSHILKHQVLHHGGSESPKFHFRPVKFYQSALGRQIAEAVRIEMMGEDVVLNSKSEFNRSKIGRLTLGDEKEQERSKDLARGEETEPYVEEGIRNWEGERAQTRRIQELQGTINLERGVARSPPRKRLGEETPERRKRKLKFPLLADKWGEEEQECPPPQVPPPPHTPTTGSSQHTLSKD